MSEFNKDDYLNDLPDADQAANCTASSAPAEPEEGSGQTGSPKKDYSATNGDSTHTDSATSDASETPATPGENGTDDTREPDATDAGQADEHSDGEQSDGDEQSDRNEQSDTLTPLGQAKKEAAEYLDALQRERAEFVNFRNRSKKEQDRFREHGIIDVLTALLPALDDIDRIREHSDIDESLNAVATKIDKAFEKFGVEKFGEKGEDFDPTKHEAILHRPDANATSETVDAVVEAGYRIGERVIRAARVVVVSPQN